MYTEEFSQIRVGSPLLSCFLRNIQKRDREEGNKWEKVGWGTDQINYHNSNTGLNAKVAGYSCNTETAANTSFEISKRMRASRRD